MLQNGSAKVRACTQSADLARGIFMMGMASTPGVQDGGGIKRRRKRAVVLDYLDELEPPAPLHKKVRQMEQRRVLISSAPDDKSSGIVPTVAATDSVSADELPVFVASDELAAETDLEGHGVRAQCRRLIDLYDELELGLLFASPEENCGFRLLVYAVAYGLARGWPKDPVHVRVLKRVLKQVSGTSKSDRRQSLSTENNTGVSGTKSRTVVGSGRRIVVTTQDIEVPKRIHKRLGI